MKFRCDPASQLVRLLGAFFVGEGEHTLCLVHQCAELLLLVGHTGRERDDVPVHVGVALLTAEAQDVDALGGDRLRECSTDGTDQGLQLEVAVECEVLDNSFSMIDRGDEDVTALDVEVGQERDVAFVSVDDELSAR